MEVVIIKGGLGNQMSQYAFYLAKKKRNKKVRVIFNPASKNIHNGSELDRVFNIKYANSIINKILTLIYKYYDGIPKLRKYFHFFNITSIVEQKNYDYNPTFLQKIRKKGIYFYVGGWHSEKYFKDIEGQIRQTFSFKLPKNNSELSKIAQIIKQQPFSVSVHIRRGDYINHPNFWGVANEIYYKKAISLVKDMVVNPHFFVFSNDLKWSDNFFKSLNVNYTLCDVGKGNNSYLDMYLMTLCQIHINANSTFSWWGGWLANSKSITICPKKFMINIITKDIYPDNWIKIAT